MDRPRHPNVIRTWAVERTHHNIHNIPPVKHDNPQHSPPRNVLPTVTPKRPPTDKKKP